LGPRLPTDRRTLTGPGEYAIHGLPGLIFVAALALRIPGLFHDFWLDEAWSYQLVREFVSSPFDVLTRIHVDNNHPLNSWFLYALGERPWYVYRLPSLVLGTAAVALAGAIMSRRGRPHAVATMILVGSSYPLIVYASEARGYAAMIFFVLLAIDAYERYLLAPRWTALVTFWIAAALGTLSHLTFLQAYGAILLWSAYAENARSADLRHALANMVRLHAIPLLFLAGFYLVYVRHLAVAGAEPAGLTSVVVETIATTLGAAPRGAWAWFACAVIGFLLVASLRTMRRVDTAFFILLLTGILLIPALAVCLELRAALIEPRFFPRYFLVSITFFLLLSGWFVGEQYEHDANRRLFAAIFVAMYVSGNLWHAASFMWYGRGHYREALLYMAQSTDEPEIRVSSNSDFRTSTLLAFYRPYLPHDKTLTFYPRSSPRFREVTWRIVEDLDPNPDVPLDVEDREGRRFRMVKRLPFYGLSGCQWSLYRRISAPADPASGRPQ
jgi:hypothetical protein